jgi:hypothetical protein
VSQQIGCSIEGTNKGHLSPGLASTWVAGRARLEQSIARGSPPVQARGFAPHAAHGIMGLRGLFQGRGGAEGVMTDIAHTPESEPWTGWRSP